MARSAVVEAYATGSRVMLTLLREEAEPHPGLFAQQIGEILDLSAVEVELVCETLAREGSIERHETEDGTPYWRACPLFEEGS